jgi:transposase
MGKPYSIDLRERVVAAIEAGNTRAEVAELYNLALSTVGRFIKLKRETGRVEPEKFGGYKTFSLEPHTELVKDLVAQRPDSTLAELQAGLAKQKVQVSLSAIHRFLRYLNLTFKKRAYTQRSRIAPMSPRPAKHCEKRSRNLIRSGLSS